DPAGAKVQGCETCHQIQLGGPGVAYVDRIEARASFIRHHDVVRADSLGDRVVQGRFQLHVAHAHVRHADALASVEACDVGDERLEHEHTVVREVLRDAGETS